MCEKTGQFTTPRTYIVKTSRACMPSSCWGRYLRVAVLETDGRTSVASISMHSRGVIRIVETWERLFKGTTDRCAAAKAVAEARRVIERLQAEEKEQAAYIAKQDYDAALKAAQD